MKSHPSRHRQFLLAVSMIAVIVAVGILFEFGGAMALLGSIVLAVAAIFAIVWQSRSRALRRLEAALDRYVEKDTQARIGKIPRHAA
jgi:low affinity Fe/Cu permease